MQLAEHRQGEDLDAAAEDVVGGERLVAHLAEVRRPRVGHVEHHVRGDVRVELELPVVEHVPPGGVEELREHLVGAEAVALPDQPRLQPELVEALGVALRPGALAGELHLEQLPRHPLEEPEVQERDAVVLEQEEVPRVRVAGELPVAVHAPEVEAEDDLADAVARGLVELLDGVEAEAGDEL